MQKILITGVAGFVGYNVAKMLLQDTDCEIIGIDCLNSEVSSAFEKHMRIKSLKNIAGTTRQNTDDAIEFPHVESKHDEADSKIRDRQISNRRFTFYKIDICDLESLKSVFCDTKPELVFHAAALVMDRRSVIEPFRYINVNVIGSQNLLEATQNLPNKKSSVRHIVLASTRSAVGEAENDSPTAKVRVDSLCFPVNVYGATKVAMEALAHSHHTVTGVSISIIRFQPMYGPHGRSDMAVKRLFETAIYGKEFKKFGHGQATRDWLYIDDAARGVCLALKKALPGYHVFNFGTGVPTSLDQLISLIAEISQVNLNITTVETVLGDAKHGGVADISDARCKLGWEPRVSLRDGLEASYSYYKDQYDNSRLLVGLAGAGIFANKAHGPALQRSANCDLVAVYSRNNSNRDNFVNKFVVSRDVATRYGDFSEFVQSSEFTAIDLVVPTNIIGQMIFQALSAGKHILSEKPIAESVMQAELLIDSWHRSYPDTIWLVSENWRLEPAFARAKEIINQNKIGQIGHIQCDCVVKRTVNSPYERSNWRQQAGRGGWLRDIGVHMFAALRVLVDGDLQFLTAIELETQQPHRNVRVGAEFLSAGIRIKLNFHYEVENTLATSDRDTFKENFNVFGSEGVLSVTRKNLTVKNTEETKIIEEKFSEYTVDKSIELFAKTVTGRVVDDNHPLHPKQALADLQCVESINNHLQANRENSLAQTEFRSTKRQGLVSDANNRHRFVASSASRADFKEPSSVDDTKSHAI